MSSGSNNLRTSNDLSGAMHPSEKHSGFVNLIGRAAGNLIDCRRFKIVPIYRRDFLQNFSKISRGARGLNAKRRIGGLCDFSLQMILSFLMYFISIV
jgi:hypothetical protein